MAFRLVTKEGIEGQFDDKIHGYLGEDPEYNGFNVEVEEMEDTGSGDR